MPMDILTGMYLAYRVQIRVEASNIHFVIAYKNCSLVISKQIITSLRNEAA